MMWRAIVTHTTPTVRVRIPGVTGQGVVPVLVFAVGGSVAVNDRVWVTRIAGYSDWLLVNSPTSGSAGATGQGWTAGTAMPTGAPTNNQVFYLRTTTGDVHQWNGAAWPVVATLKGAAGNDGKSVELQKTSTAIQWRQTPGGTFTDLVALSAITGPQGPAGAADPGIVSAFGGTNAPSGWLPCDGAAVSRSVYANLFTAIGTTHGAGNGTTTFNVPNLLGRVVVGQTSGDTDFTPVGKTSGAKTAAHTHALSDAGQAQIYLTNTGQAGLRRITTASYSESLNWTATRTAGTAGAQTLGTALAGATDSAAPATLQPGIALLYIIKT